MLIALCSQFYSQFIIGLPKFGLVGNQGAVCDRLAIVTLPKNEKKTSFLFTTIGQLNLRSDLLRNWSTGITRKSTVWIHYATDSLDLFASTRH